MTSWKNIHEDFDELQSSWTSGEKRKSYQQLWEEEGLTYQDAQILISTGFEPDDYRKVKKWKSLNFTSQQIKEFIDIGFLLSDANFFQK